jgi:LysM repeat protein
MDPSDVLVRRPDTPGERSRLGRPLVLAMAVTLALAPAACSTLTGSGGSGTEDPSATTVFRTITVELATSTSAPPAAGVGGGATPSAVTLSPDVYEVQQGDYWYGIAKKLGVDVNLLWAVNNANADTLLLPGRRLAIPKAGDSATAGLQPPTAGGDAGASGTTAQATPTLAPGSAAGSYQIVPGDSWYGIANKLNVSINSLLSANGANLDTILLAGKYLKVPKS